jgi:hypothetical protein
MRNDALCLDVLAAGSSSRTRHCLTNTDQLFAGCPLRRSQRHVHCRLWSLEAIDIENRALLSVTRDESFDFGDLLVFDLESKCQHHRHSRFFNDDVGDRDALPHVEEVLTIRTDFRSVLPQPLAEFQRLCVFRESDTGRRGQRRRIVRNHGVQILRDHVS